MEYYIENLLKHINYPTGFYIECGANDGITQSYTYELEKMEWNGILVEPSLKAFNDCIKNRSKNNFFYNCALVSSEEIKEIVGDFDGSLMSSIYGKRKNRIANIMIKCRTLNSILEELNIKKIDLFSLDVEGYELEVLKGFNINKYKPKYILIEIYDDIKNDIFNLMQSNDYVVLDNLTGYNKKDFPVWDGTHNDYLFINNKI